ncbi:hypothetical protein Hanom_Chr07g00612981 [Helianthus anomalus]
MNPEVTRNKTNPNQNSDRHSFFKPAGFWLEYWSESPPLPSSSSSSPTGRRRTTSNRCYSPISLSSIVVGIPSDKGFVRRSTAQTAGQPVLFLSCYLLRTTTGSWWWLSVPSVEKE